MKPSEPIEKTKLNINKIFEEEKGEYICDFGVTNCAYSDKVFDSIMCEVSDLQDKLDKRFIDREELKKKIKKIFRDNVQDGNIRDGCMDYYDLDIEKKILELIDK